MNRRSTSPRTAWAAVHHATWTRDPQFLLGPARPLLVETARYWASRCHVDHDGRAHIDGVIGPHEYHADVDDNAYTNIMARWNLRTAADVAERAGVAIDEASRWRDLAGRIVDGLDPATRRHEQFAGYDTLETLTLEGPLRPPVAADILLGQERVAAHGLLGDGHRDGEPAPCGLRPRRRHPGRRQVEVPRRVGRHHAVGRHDDHVGASGKYWTTTVRGNPERRPRVVRPSARRCHNPTIRPRVRRNSHAPSGPSASTTKRAANPTRADVFTLKPLVGKPSVTTLRRSQRIRSRSAGSTPAERPSRGPRASPTSNQRGTGAEGTSARDGLGSAARGPEPTRSGALSAGASKR